MFAFALVANTSSLWLCCRLNLCLFIDCSGRSDLWVSMLRQRRSCFYCMKSHNSFGFKFWITKMISSSHGGVGNSKPRGAGVSACFPNTVGSLMADYLDQVCSANWNMPEQGMLGKLAGMQLSVPTTVVYYIHTKNNSQIHACLRF